MQSYTLNRPDGALLCRVLEQHTNDAAGAILRLAWMAGLMRDEIQHLTWAQVDLLGEQLLLPDRAVPLAPELAACWRPCVGSGTAAANGWCCRTGTSSPWRPSPSPAWPAPRWTPGT